MIETIPPKRGNDSWGSGEYGAPRGDRKHKGIDFNACPNTKIKSHVSGIVSKLGYPYEDDLSYRYIQITTEDGYDYRFFYIAPSVKVGQKIHKGDIIGRVQDLSTRYKGISNHFHFEVKINGEYLDPNNYLGDK